MKEWANSSDFDFNPLDPAYLADPRNVIRGVRDRCRAYLHDQGSISFFHYDDIKSIVGDWQTFSSVADPASKGVANPENIPLAFEDPPEHDIHRAIVNHLFTPGHIRRQEPLIQQYVDEIIDEVIDKPEFDAVEDFAGKITTRMIAQLLGIPQEGLEEVRYWTKVYSHNDSFFLFLPADHPRVIETGKEFDRLMTDMPKFFEGVIDDHLAHPGRYDDILSVLVDAGLPRQTLNGFCVLILVAGNDTTANLISNALKLLTDHPDQQQLLRDEPGLVNRAVEEIVRYMPSIRFGSRRATRDTAVAGVPIQKDQWVNVWWIAANMDEKVCSDPHTFDITRKPTRHISFAHGLHSCLGNALARAEARVTLQRIVERTKDVVRVRQEIPPLEAISYNGVAHHWIKFVT